MNVVDRLVQRAGEWPDRIAIIDRTARTPRSITFAELERAGACAAHAFVRAGLTPGARVVVLHPMRIELYVALAGLLRAGLVPVVCDPAAGRTYVARCIDAVQPAALFASPRGMAYAATVPALARIPARFTPKGWFGTRALDDTATELPVEHRRGSDPALITFTSGSTGTPKVVVRSHALLAAQLDALHDTLGHGGIDVPTMPIVLLANLATGITSMIPGVNVRRPGTIDANRLANDIAQTNARSIVASPALLARLLHVRDRGQLAGLRRIVTGGAPVMPSLTAALHAAFPAARIVTVYGSTEAEPIAHLDDPAASTTDRAALACGDGLLAGRVTTHATVRIIANAWGSTLTRADALPPGSAGEIIVAGAHVVPGYLDGTGDAETKIHAGGHVWHRTGDLGRIDAAGRLWLLGRAAAAMTDNRGTLYPFAVEAALSEHTAIERSALIDVNGRRVIAVQFRPHMRVPTTELLAAMTFAAIDDVRVVARIPVDARHNAKVDYPALRRLLGVRA